VTWSCSPPRSGGGAGGAQTATGDDELIGEEAAAKEVLLSEAIAVGSGLKWVLDVEARMAAQILGLHDDGEQWQWRSMARTAAGTGGDGNNGGGHCLNASARSERGADGWAPPV
jgi:hypothetical protein